jgi:hypothetical protein
MTPLSIGIVLGLLFLGDLIATYSYIAYIRKRYPKIDYKEFEINVFVGWAWNKFGFERGTLIAPLLLSPFWFLIYIGSIYDPHSYYLILGVYLLLFVIHYSNITSMLSKKATNFSRIYDKVYGRPDDSPAYALFKGGR